MDATDTGEASQVLSSDFTVEDAGCGHPDAERRAWNVDAAQSMGHSFDAAIPLTLTPLPGQELKPWLVDYRAGFTYGGITTGSAALVHGEGHDLDRDARCRKTWSWRSSSRRRRFTRAGRRRRNRSTT
jgi:hypothetical protein